MKWLYHIPRPRFRGGMCSAFPLQSSNQEKSEIYVIFYLTFENRSVFVCVHINLAPVYLIIKASRDKGKFIFVSGWDELNAHSIYQSSAIACFLATVKGFLHLWIDFNRATFTYVKHLRAILIGRAPSVQPPDRRSWSDELSSSNRSTRLFVTRATNGDVTGVTCDHHGGVNPTKAFFLLLLPSFRGSVESIRKCANTIF